jgi:BirA family biotin operon repressor/biotin-[acetyl-CoA-carboxylase] ligase
MRNSLRPLQGPVRLLHLAAVDSTNAEALRRAAAGEDSGLWIVADRQSQGRGRSGRSWHSPPGNLYASLLLHLGCPPATAQQLSLVAGVATIEALSALAGDVLATKRLRLKWPNDILLDGAKLGGILIESTTITMRQIAVVGIGVNLASAPAELGHSATYLGTLGRLPAPDDVVRALVPAVQHWLAIWQEGAEFGAIRSAWLERAGPPGEAIAVNTGTGPTAGTFLGLDETGALLLRNRGGCKLRFTFGDVSLSGMTGGEEQ